MDQKYPDSWVHAKHINTASALLAIRLMPAFNTEIHDDDGHTHLAKSHASNFKFINENIDLQFFLSRVFLKHYQSKFSPSAILRMDLSTGFS